MTPPVAGTFSCPVTLSLLKTLKKIKKVCLKNQ
jgi:hypothetical protein